MRRRSVEAYAGCVAGASLKDEYLRLIREAGFGEIEVLEERTYQEGTYGAPDALLPAADPASVEGSLRSMKVRAFKPRA